MTTIRTAAVTLLALGSLIAIDVRPSAAEIYRPWCVVYQGSRDGATSCAFTSFAQCMMTGGPGTGGSCVQNPWYLAYGERGPAVAPTGQGGRVRRPITGLSNGGFVVTWGDGSGLDGDIFPEAIKAQVFDAIGTKVGGEFLVNTRTTGSQNIPVIAGLSNGGFVIAWNDFRSDLGSSTRAQVFDATGTKVGSEFLVAGVGGSVDIAGLDGGGFVIVWGGLNAQVFDATGTKVGSQFLVNDTTTENSPAITDPTGGRFVIAWEDSSAVIRAQIFGMSDNDPVITTAGTQTVAENTTAVTTVTATDPDAGQTLTYTISGGADAGKFTIGSTTGALSFITAPNFEAPTDAGANNIYDVTVQVSDGSGGTDTQALAVTVTDVFENSAPTITSNGGGSTAAISIAEHATAVTTVMAIDPDAGQALSYVISGGADASKFTINAATGALSFITAPNFELPTDAGGNNVYDVIVQASDDHGGIDTQAIAVSVTDVLERTVQNFDGINQSDFLWQHDSGQAAVWLLNGTSAMSGAAVGSNPGPSWHLEGAGDFNADGRSDFLWQNDSGQAAIWLMNGTSLIGGATVGSNPGPSWHVIDAGDFNGDGHDRHSLAERQWPSRHLADERDEPGRRRRGRLQSGAELARRGRRRLQRRRQERHPVAERQRPGRHLADGRHERDRRRHGRVATLGPSWHVIDAGDFNGDGNDRHSLAERQWPGRRLADERDERDRRRRGRLQSGAELARRGRRRLQRRQQERHPVAERQWPGGGMANGRHERDRRRAGRRESRRGLAPHRLRPARPTFRTNTATLFSASLRVAMSHQEGEFTLSQSAG